MAKACIEACPAVC